ncbi:hypothetical protein MSG28_014199 [Choristoneura fumiferana]|uniref:Uncharacterized protein n=1 Tax=Choristoneura fumiferana TaxID=7141 RepID=A0ACC0JGA0_CHOFU|nr:hypothetical protein MSG28_014199 [Choristoneura fumiferana]
MADDKLEKSLSESNLPDMDIETSSSARNITTRNKRRREDDFVQFKEDITSMMTAMMDSQMTEIKKNTRTLEEIKQTNRSIEDSMSFLSAQYEEYRLKIDTLEAAAVEDRKYIASLESKIVDLQRENRKSNIEIKNVPTQKSESKDTLINLVSHLGNTISCPINKSDIKDLYRDFNVKNNDHLSAKHLGLKVSPDMPIYVAEQLTPQAARLHFLARELKRANSYKYCWTSYGRVYLRKDDNSPIIHVTSETQIERLGKENPATK